MMEIRKEEILFNVSEALEKAEKLMAAESWKEAAELMNKAIKDIDLDYVFPNTTDDTGWEAIIGEVELEKENYQTACDNLYKVLPSRCDSFRHKVTLKHLDMQTEECLTKAATLINENKQAEANDLLKKGIQLLGNEYNYFKTPIAGDVSADQIIQAKQKEGNGDIQSSVALLQAALQFRLDNLRSDHQEWLADF